MSGGLKVTKNADNVAVELKAVNDDGSTAKPLVIDLGPTPVINDVSKYFTLRSGSSDFLGIRRWRSDLGGGLSGYETQISGLALDNNLGTQSDYVVVGFERIAFQPVDIFECNPGGNLYMGHGTDDTWFWRNGANLGYTIDVQLRHVGVTTFKARPGVTGVEWGYTAADTDGIGGYMLSRGQQGFAGFVGGAWTGGAGDGGTPGTNAPGLSSIKTGTPVAALGGKFALTHEDGTKYLEIHQPSAGVVQIGGGAVGAETHNLFLRSTYVQLETTTGFITLVPVTDLYMGHGANAGDRVHHRESGTIVMQERNDADGVSYFNWLTGITGFELQYNGAGKFKFNTSFASTTVDGSYCYLGTVANCAGAVVQAATYVVNHATTIYSNSDNHLLRSFGEITFERKLPFSLTTAAGTVVNVGTYTLPSNTCVRVRTTFTAYNTVDIEIGSVVREACFLNNAGTTTQQDATVAIGTDFRGTNQATMNGTIDNSGNDIRNRATPPSADSTKWRVVMEIWESAA